MKSLNKVFHNLKYFNNFNKPEVIDYIMLNIFNHILFKQIS
jgi:hypothetical protein